MKKHEFQKKVWDYYRQYGRHDLPWRTVVNPYRVTVSEIMLQQTQVDRVIPKFRNWLRQFPNWKQLANAPRREVLLAWQGLGYNNRAVRLHELAQIITRDYAGRLPTDRDCLEQLPGIGPYTSGAVCAFAYNQPVVFIDTNIRRTYIHHFFSDQQNVHDRDLLPVITDTIDQDNPREWYWALMDYGSHLGRELKQNPNMKSRHYSRQSKFAGSDRQLRGEILRHVLVADELSKIELLKIEAIQKWPKQKIEHVLDQMVVDKILSRQSDGVLVVSD